MRTSWLIKFDWIRIHKTHKKKESVNYVNFRSWPTSCIYTHNIIRGWTISNFIIKKNQIHGNNGTIKLVVSKNCFIKEDEEMKTNHWIQVHSWNIRTGIWAIVLVLVIGASNGQLLCWCSLINDIHQFTPTPENLVVVLYYKICKKKKSSYLVYAWPTSNNASKWCSMLWNFLYHVLTTMIR